VVVDVAGQAGLVGLKRALDSAPLFDAEATQDTVTLMPRARAMWNGKPGRRRRAPTTIWRRASRV
jgi:hypothetical protein